MCLPSLIKQYILLLLPFSFVFISKHWIMGIIVLLIGVVSFFIKCPKCRKSLSVSKSGIYRPSLLHCDKCGQNLMRCQV
jgi:transposase-like protein